MRSRWRAAAEETVTIAERGSYVVGGREVTIRDQVARAVAGTALHRPEDSLTRPTASPVQANVRVTNETSLAAARRLGAGVACLNFASARNPGGGFLNGDQAQEESLARGSGVP